MDSFYATCKKLVAARICEQPIVWLTVLAAAFWPSGEAQAHALSKLPSANYLCQSWQSEEGLPYPIIRSIIQTHDGYLVIGTQEGVLRFDGVDFKVASEGTLPDRKNRSFVPLFETRDGSLWYSDRDTGLVRAKDGNITHFGPKEGMTNGYVFCLYEDRSGYLWIGAEDGTARWKDGQLETIHGSDGQPVASIRAIIEDSKGRILMASPRGLKEWKDGAIQTASAPTITGLTWSLLETKDHGLWIGTSDGLFCWRDQKLQHLHAGEGLANNTIRSLCEDHMGTLWVGTYGGIFKLSGNQLVPIRFDFKLDTELIYAITEDQEGDIWVGSNNGLSRLRPRRFQTYTKEDGLGQDNISSICGDKTNGIWIATWGAGLGHLQNGAITNWSHTNGFVGNIILGVCQRRNGTLWVETGGGLDIYQNDLSRRFSTNSGLGDKVIKVIFEDSKSKMWLGGEESLTVYDHTGFKPYIPPGHATFDNVNDITEDHAGNIWVASNNGLTRIQPGIYQRFTEKDGLGSHLVDAVYSDREGTLWIGTESAGLNWWKGGKFYHCDIPDGMPCEEITQILDDDLGHLWLGSRKGIIRVDKQQLFDLATKKTNSVTPIIFGRTDGLMSIQCNHVAQPAAYKDKSGRLWFATSKGAAVVDPKQFQVNTYLPPVLLKQVRVNGQIVPMNDKPTYGPAVKELEFFFTALSFQAASKVQFKVKLEGFDSDWKDSGNRRRYRYTGLRPGHYTFRIMACNDDNIWNELRTPFAFTVAPKFRETKLFYGLCALGIFACGLFLNRLRVVRLKKREKELVKTVAERTEFARHLEKEIQERKLAEAALQESQKIILRQERLAAVGQLSAGVAHEFNNILTVILGHASLLNDQVRIPKVNESISQIVTSAERAAQLTRQMLAFSRKQILQPAVVQLNDVVRQEVQMLGRVVEESVSLQMSLAPKLPLIWADTATLEQVIMNLSLNARDAMPKGGRLEIQTGEMQVDAAAATRHHDAYPGHFVYMKVMDAGIGMAPETMQRIFEPFFTTKDVGKGTGLGLSTVYGIVKQHSGWIEVASKVGVGTTFTVLFPVHNGANKAKQAADQAQTNGH